MLLKKLLFLMAAGAASFPFNIRAAQERVDDEGWYIGASYGYADTRIEAESESSDFPTQTEGAAAYGLYWGHNFNEWFGLEGAAFKTGDIAGDRDQLDRAEFDSIYSVTPTFSYRVNPGFSLNARIGLSWMGYRELYSDYIGRYGNSNDWAGIAGTAGIGVQFDITDDVRIRIDYDKLAGKLEQRHLFVFIPVYDDLEAEIDRLSAGVHFQF